MDFYLYKVFGYKTNNLLYFSALKIQKAYKNHKDYEIKKRLDIINNNNFPKNTNYEKDIYDENEELKYWGQMRNIIKYEKYNYICL